MKAQTYGRSLLLASQGALLILLVADLALNVAQAPLIPGLNGPRMMAALAVRFGFRLYNDFSTGPLFSGLNGPVEAFVYLPAAYISTPSLALVAASALAVTLCLGAAAFFFRRGTGIWSWVLFAFCVLSDEGLRQSVFSVHADAPGLALMTAAFLAWESGRRSLAGILTALCIFTKLTFLPLVFVFPSVALFVALALFQWLAGSIWGAEVFLSLIHI